MQPMNTQEQTPQDGEGKQADEARRTGRAETTLRRIGAALDGLRFGSVLAIVQDGVVVAIERTEKTRLGR
jgi:hypothetical protein